MSSQDIFRAKAPKVISWLMHDFGLQDFQAAGIVGNTGRECAGFTELREVGQPAGHGGYGWQQWTGPRAHLFLNFCAAHKLDWRSDTGNYQYLRHELQTTYAFVVSHLHECKTVEEATEVFEKYYERAGVPAMADRIAWAKIALSAGHSTIS
jgi:hypothetical protein